MLPPDEESREPFALESPETSRTDQESVPLNSSQVRSLAGGNVPQAEAPVSKCRTCVMVVGLPSACLLLGMALMAWYNMRSMDRGARNSVQNPDSEVEFERRVEKDLEMHMSQDISERMQKVEQQVMKDAEEEMEERIKEHRGDTEQSPQDQTEEASTASTTHDSGSFDHLLPITGHDEGNSSDSKIRIEAAGRRRKTQTLNETVTKTITTTWTTTSTLTETSTTTEIATTTSKAVGSTSLFCWLVMRPEGYELSLVRSQLAKGAGIFACDGWSVFSDVKTMLSPGPPVRLDSSTIHISTNSASGSSTHFLNTDVFTAAWDRIHTDGKYLDHAWVVKADPDAVFFPERLRSHVQSQHPLAGVGMYLLNCKYHDGNFWFFGALEVLSRGAVATYFKGKDTCMNSLNRGELGEDTWLRKCLDMLGVGNADDIGLLADGYCDEAPSPCISGKVAFHPFKNPDSWFVCWNEAQKSR